MFLLTNDVQKPIAFNNCIYTFSGLPLYRPLNQIRQFERLFWRIATSIQKCCHHPCWHRLFYTCVRERTQTFSNSHRTVLLPYFPPTLVQNITTPILQWYLNECLVVSHIYQVVEYEPKPCFKGFGDSVSDSRRQDDLRPDIIVADTMTLVGNSGYGKILTNVQCHRDVYFCNDKAAARDINSYRFWQSDQISESL